VGSRYLTDLPDVIAGAGLRVVVVDGWESRANTKGGFDGHPVGVVEHHTAGAVDGTLEGELSVLINGNSAAPGPIAQLLLWRDAVVYVVAAGRCNHAGEGWWPDIGSMNSEGIGIEQANNGTGEWWSAQMIDASVRLTTALVGAYGIPVGNVVSHREWAPDRKIDPAGPWAAPTAGMTAWTPDDMGPWRQWIVDLLATEPGDDMALTLMQCTDADAAFLAYTVGGVAAQVEWADRATFDAYAGLVDHQDITRAQVANCTLLGPLPEGDSRHHWGPGDFRRHLG
jgi:N-acetylmuramoyl-L-alanine amidase